MDNSIVEILRYIQNTYGEDIFYNFGRANNLLNDLCPHLTQERIQTKNFIELNGYFMLKYAGSAYPIVRSKLVDAYMGTYRVDEKTAAWIVDVFGVLLGYMTVDRLVPPTAGIPQPEGPIPPELLASQVISGYAAQTAGKNARVVVTPDISGLDITATAKSVLSTLPIPTGIPMSPRLPTPPPSQNHSLIAADYHTVAVKHDGTVMATGYNNAGQCNIRHWQDIVSVAAGASYTVGLRSDGTVTAAGLNDHGQCDVGRWRDIIAISAGARHTLGLRRDGTVMATGDNKYGECNVSGWRNITTIVAGNQCTYAIKKDKKVLSRGYNKDGEYDISWHTNIVGVANAYPYGALALKSDGTVVKACRAMKGDFRRIRNISAIAATPDCFIGLRRDGTVRILAYYWESSGVECSTDEWTDIIAIAAGRYHVVGLRRDGTLQVVMLHTHATLDKGQCDVGLWSGLRV